jgi:hypothetical protein
VRKGDHRKMRAAIDFAVLAGTTRRDSTIVPRWGFPLMSLDGAEFK